MVGVGVLEFRAVKAGPSSISVASEHGSQGTKCPSVFHGLVQITSRLPFSSFLLMIEVLPSLVTRATALVIMVG